MKNDAINRAELIKALNIFKGKSLFEIRILKKSPKRTWSGYFKDPELAADELEKMDLRGLNTYFTLNEIDEACYSRTQHDKIIMAPEATTSDENISSYQWLFIDLDPKRPADISSTDEELSAAKELAKRVYAYLKKKCFEDPIVAMSGNGMHLLYNIALKNSEENANLIQNCLQALSLMFSTDLIKVDTANFNPARICKLYGTLSQKGAGTEERPHRMTYIISVPDEIKPTRKPYLEKLAAELPQKEAPQKYNNFRPSTFDAREWMDKHGLRYTEKADGKDYKKFILDCCPFNSEHKAPDSMITVGPSGAIGFKCFHNSCQGKTWKDVRLLFEPDAYSHNEDDARIEAGWREHKKHNRDLEISYEEPEEETDEEPYFLTAEDILKRPDEEDEFIRSGIEGIDNRLRGLKKKYVTLMTGLRGGSKSTLLTSIALTAVQDGHNVLCYSGELSDKDFMQWMNLQAAGKQHTVESKKYPGYYSVSDQDRRLIAKWLGEHFLLWNNVHGNSFSKLYKQIEKMIEAQKTDLVILDNLMAIDIHTLNNYDKYEAQSDFVELLVSLAKRTNTHIIFVAHPRKAMGMLRVEDIAGTGNLANRVDNILIVHRNNNDFKRLSKEMFKWPDSHDAYKGTNVVEIAKDRHGGTQDVFIPLWYEPESKRLKNAPAEVVYYGWDPDEGFSPLPDDIELNI